MHTRQELEKHLDHVSFAELRFIELTLGELEDQDEVELAVERIKAAREAGLSPPPADIGLTPGIRDTRWDLLRDLEVGQGNADWQAICMAGGGYSLDGRTGREKVRPVVITVDPRMPVRTLNAFLRDVWPKFRGAGLVFASRELSDWKLTLVRHVCLEMPNDSWAERSSAWNAKFAEGPYRTQQALITAHHDAEQSLTGDRHGLAHFYDARARLSLPDLGALARQGDHFAKRELERRGGKIRSFIEAIGGSVVTELQETADERSRDDVVE